MSVLLEFADRLACPDCGALAQRIGHYYVAHDGGIETIGFQEDSIFSTRDHHGMPYKMGRPGVVAMTCGSGHERFGVAMKASGDTRVMLRLTHWCTNPECAVVFSEGAGRPFTGKIPNFAMQVIREEGVNPALEYRAAIRAALARVTGSVTL